MYLKRLEIYGFKTFAQRTVFEFPPGVTAVVGPNGSGKSNVADALRWVLGEQSFANLRSKRTEDLIFGGGKGRSPMGFAEVFLTIDNSDRLLPLPYDEVTIGRRAYRNGENEYSLNRARVRLRDVADAVAPLGSSYTLINQGLVDSALALQPEDRRRLFEDAAEIGPYQAKKQEAERRLRETEANLLRLNDLVGELEPQLRALKRQARDAEAVGAVDAELGELLRHFYAFQWAAVTARVQAAEERETCAAQQLSAVSAERERAAAELLAYRDALRERRSAVEQQRQAEGELRHQLDVATRELAVVVERVAGVERRRADLQRREADLQDALALAEAQTRELDTQTDAAHGRLAAESEALAQAEAAVERVSAEQRAAEATLAARREAQIRASAKLDAERTRLLDLERRRAALAETSAQLRAALEQRRARVEQLRTMAEEAQAAVTAAEAAIMSGTTLVDRLRTELDEARKERERSDEQITAAQREHSELQARHDALARLARSYEGTFAGVRAAMQWAERERRPGFVLVSALLRVPSELETAIEVALGARLQQIVVERWSDAEAAIAQLKRTGAGRATFLPLDTLKPGRRLAVPELPGIRGVAADLVAVDAHYATIRSYLLGRILIADDLEAARRALPAIESGWTIVTLGGEQVATGGAVSGGAATKESGTLRRERELRELPEQIQAARTVVERHQATREAVNQALDRLMRESRNAETALRTARNRRDAAQRTAEARQRDYHRAEDELATLDRRAAELEQEQAGLAERAEQLQNVILAAVAEHDTASREVELAQRVVGEQAVVAGSDTAALRELRVTVSHLEADVRAIAAELQTQQRAAQHASAERTAVRQQVERLGEEREQLAQQTAAWEQQHRVLAAELAGKRAGLQAEQDALRAQERELEAQEARERELTEQTLAAEAGHAEAAVTLQRYRSERDGLWERAAEDNIDVESLMATAAPGEAEVGDRSTPEALPQRIEQLRARLRRMGPVNALAPQEYNAAQERHAFLSAQLADVRSAAATLRDAIDQLDQVMHEHFEATFSAVAREFGRTFTQLFGGGTARLVLLHGENGSDAYGIDIVAQPPGKRQLNLQLLSGGERALTAAALLFAILTVNPSPFCMLDEVDAALDEANVVRFRAALLQLAQKTQFILITHNRGTVEAADTLYGITMQADLGISKVVSLRLQELDETLDLHT